jgi:cytochrome c peroxidase
MNMPLAGLTERLAGIGEYKPLFAAVFGMGAITAQNVAKALATFERTVVSASAPFDSWIEGDEKAISEDAKRGFVLFNAKAGCAQCHRGWNFTDDSFHDVGLESPDLGRGKSVPDTLKLQHAFKTPGLREIARRAPFTHDGSLPTLEEVVDHYDRGGIERPSRSDVIKPLGLTPQEKADLLAFLQTLTGRAEPMSVPLLPR